jgi:AhpD family alkylhydroperoxidase
MIQYITPVRPQAATGLVSDVYRQIKHDFGAVVPPFSCHSILPRLMAGVWSAFRESMLIGSVPRDIKEAIAVSVSQSNHCSFCVEAHVVMLHAVKAHDAACALVNGRSDRLSDRMRAVTAWAGATGGAHSTNSAFHARDAEAPELIGTVVFFQYINRICGPILSGTPLPSSREWLRPFLSRSAGWYFSFAARRPKMAGASLSFLPDAPLPADMNWAAGNPTLAGAWARLAHEVEQQGRLALGPETIDFAVEYLDGRNRESMHGDASAIEASTNTLSNGQRDAARLVLLTVLAPQHVNDEVIRGFVDPVKAPEKLLGAIAWASFTAARRIGASLKFPTQMTDAFTRDGESQSRMPALQSGGR